MTSTEPLHPEEHEPVSEVRAFITDQLEEWATRDCSYGSHEHQRIGRADIILAILSNGLAIGEIVRRDLRRPRHPRAPVVQCYQGHAYNEKNTYINPRGHRECRICRAARMRALKRRRKEEVVKREH